MLYSAGFWPAPRTQKVPSQKNPYGPVAQGIEQQPSKLKVAGSNPAGVANRIRHFLRFLSLKILPNTARGETRKSYEAADLLNEAGRK
jgi:hypothetical protein